MHERHKLGSADTSKYQYTSWQRLKEIMLTSSPTHSETNINAGNLRPLKIANLKISNAFWKIPKIKLKDQINVLKYRTDTIYTQKHVNWFRRTYDCAHCPLCGAIDSANHITLGCAHPTIQGMIMNRHHTAVSLCGKAISKGRFGSSIIAMDACASDKLLEQDMEVPEDITRAIPDWLFPNGTCPSIRYQSRPDAILVRPIPGRATHLDPNKYQLKTGISTLLS